MRGRRGSFRCRRLVVAFLFVVLDAAWLSPPARAVDCSPNDITLSDQFSVDNFQSLFGPCDTVVGTLTVSGADITNLNGLSGLTSVLWFNIQNNGQLTSLGGLSSLMSVGDALWIQNNDSLINLDGMIALTSLGGLFVGGNDSLTSVAGLTADFGSLTIAGNQALTTVSGLSGATALSSLIIESNPSLVAIDGLNNVTSVNDDFLIWDNPSLTSLGGLSSLTFGMFVYIEENASLPNLDGLSSLASVHSLTVLSNGSLTNVNGLSSLSSVQSNLSIDGNPVLGDCCGLFPILSGGGVAGTADIRNNLTGCNSVAEILALCAQQPTPSPSGTPTPQPTARPVPIEPPQGPPSSPTPTPPLPPPGPPGTAELVLDVTASPQVVSPGGSLVFDYTLQNVGPADATGVRLTASLDAQIGFESGQGCAANGQVVTCNHGTLTASGTTTGSILTRVADGAQGTIDTSFHGGAEQPDPTPDNATVDLQVLVAAAVPTLPAPALILLLSLLVALGLAAPRRS